MKNKKVIIIGAVIAAGLLIGLLLYRYQNRNNTFMKYKIKKYQPVVTTIFQEGDIYVPGLNLKGELASSINNQIVEDANNFLVDDNTIGYTYDINGDVLSLAVFFQDYNRDEYPGFSANVYNINVKKQELISDEDLLDMFKISKEEVSKQVEEQFRKYYQDLFDKHYFDEECSYECFLNMREIKNENYLENSHFYVKNGNLNVVRPFGIFSPFDEEKYFNIKHFFFQIKD